MPQTSTSDLTVDMLTKHNGNLLADLYDCQNTLFCHFDASESDRVNSEAFA